MLTHLEWAAQASQSTHSNTWILLWVGFSLMESLQSPSPQEEISLLVKVLPSSVAAPQLSKSQLIIRVQLTSLGRIKIHTWGEWCDRLFSTSTSSFASLTFSSLLQFVGFNVLHNWHTHLNAHTQRKSPKRHTHHICVQPEGPAEVSSSKKSNVHKLQVQEWKTGGSSTAT